MGAGGAPPPYGGGGGGSSLGGAAATAGGGGGGEPTAGSRATSPPRQRPGVDGSNRSNRSNRHQHNVSADGRLSANTANISTTGATVTPLAGSGSGAGVGVLATQSGSWTNDSQQGDEANTVLRDVSALPEDSTLFSNTLPHPSEFVLLFLL